jgi:hypothetical protein
MPVSGSIALNIALSQSFTRAFGNASDPVSIAELLPLANGTGASQADRAWGGTRTLAASANEDLDLVGTALVDVTGTAVTFPKVTAVFIRAAAGNTNNVVIGAAASNPWVGLLNSTGTITLRPDAWVMLSVGSADASGYPTVAATGDLLRVANSGAGSTVTYDILVLGKSV